MSNTVNRNLDPVDPTQGRRKECARRLRQRRKEVEKRTTKLIVDALAHLTDAEIEALAQLDEAQLAYLEERVAAALAVYELLPAAARPEALAMLASGEAEVSLPSETAAEYARAVLKALQETA